MATDDRPGMEDRRKKTPFDYVSVSGGVGGAGVGLLILNMIIGQNDTLKDHSQWIHENSKQSDRVVEMLGDIQKEFELDIRAFEIGHLNLKEGMHDVQLNQAQMGTRIMSLEQMVVEQNGVKRSDLDRAIENRAVELKGWVNSNFNRKKEK